MLYCQWFNEYHTSVCKCNCTAGLFNNMKAGFYVQSIQPAAGHIKLNVHYTVSTHMTSDICSEISTPMNAAAATYQ